MNKFRILVISALIVMLIFLAASPVKADEDQGVIHEDPSIVKQVYDTLSLLSYYSGSLDLILLKNAEGTGSYLDKMPFANIPDQLVKPTANFATSGIDLSKSIADLAVQWEKQRELVEKSRLDEANQIYKQMLAALPAVRIQLNELKLSVEDTGAFLNILATPETGALRKAYQEVLDKLGRLGDMLGLFGRPIIGDQALTGILKNITPEQLKELLNSLTQEQSKELLNSASPDALKQALDVLTPEQSKELLNSASPNTLKELLASLSPEELKDLFNSLSPDVLKELLKALSPETLEKLQSSLPPGALNETLNSNNPDKLKELLAALNPDLLKEVVVASSPEQSKSIIQAVPPEQAAVALKTADPQQAKSIIHSVPPEQAAEVLQAASPALVNQILQTANPEQLSAILSSASPDILKQFLKPVILTLEVTPSTVFVGDSVVFSGLLSSQGEPLANRDVEILLNGTKNTTVTTDSRGWFQGQLQIPYWYVPEMEVQALYNPQSPDIGVYLGASSPVVKLSILYYETKLDVRVVGPAYPGKTASIEGKFDYGQSPLPESRSVELYFDNVLVRSFNSGTGFAQTLALDPKIELGQHTLTVSVPADGRYSPAIASSLLNVTRIASTLDLNTPGISLIPGSLSVSGRLYNQAGPIADAVIELSVGDSLTQVKSAQDGTFQADISIGMGFTLLGAQKLNVSAAPREPWNAPLTATRNAFVINFINLGIIVVVLGLLGFYLPRRFRKYMPVRAPRQPRRIQSPAFSLQLLKNALVSLNPLRISVNLIKAISGAVQRLFRPLRKSQPTKVPVLEKEGSVSLDIKEAPSESGEAEDPEKLANPIMFWYRIVLKVVQALSRAILKPSQTLREYAASNNQKLGPVGKQFYEFTLMMERRLYSSHKATQEEADRSRELAKEITEIKQ